MYCVSSHHVCVLVNEVGLLYECADHQADRISIEIMHCSSRRDMVEYKLWSHFFPDNQSYQRDTNDTPIWSHSHKLDHIYDHEMTIEKRHIKSFKLWLGIWIIIELSYLFELCQTKKAFMESS